MSQRFIYNPLPPLGKDDTLLNGKYEILSDTVNAGGFGRIYKAVMHPTTSNHDWIVAVKEFHVREFNDDFRSRMSMSGITLAEMNKCIELMFKKFRQEAQILLDISQQRDAHTPTLYHRVRENNGRYFYSMKFIEGYTLTEIVRRRGTMTEEVAVGYVAQVAKVLHKTHEWNLMHCDVSPNNIMLDNDFAVLVDFGNARGYMDVLDDNYKENKMLHNIGSTLIESVTVGQSLQSSMQEIGTPGFAAPRGFLGKPQGDIYSLAATLFFLLTGERHREAYTATIHKENEAKLREHGVSETTIKAILHALSRDIKQCPQSARDFLHELPNEIVIDALLNYKDHDYNRR